MIQPLFVAHNCVAIAGNGKCKKTLPNCLCRFFRRGWITFDRSVNIKEICWELNNIRVSFLFLFPFSFFLISADLMKYHETKTFYFFSL